MYEQADECNKTGINGGQAVHSQAEICSEVADLYPCPDVVENGFPMGDKECSNMRCSNAERDHKRNNSRDQDRPARDYAAEQLILQPPADQPVDDGASKRSENDDT